jgi:hypothetical protein
MSTLIPASVWSGSAGFVLRGDRLGVCYRVTPDERRRPLSLDGLQAGVFLDVFKRRTR